MSERWTEQTVDALTETGGEDFAQLVAAERSSTASESEGRIAEARIGSLVGFAPHDHTPLVTYPGQPCPEALRARTTLDLYSAHVGQEIVLLFAEGDPKRPIVVGSLNGSGASALSNSTGHVEVDADGRRLVVSATEQIVLRCGRASLTLTKEGKVVLEGAYVSHHSSGVLRLKGGSVQIN
jgi:hypothetical protein